MTMICYRNFKFFHFCMIMYASYSMALLLAPVLMETYISVCDISPNLFSYAIPPKSWTSYRILTKSPLVHNRISQTILRGKITRRKSKAGDNKKKPWGNLRAGPPTIERGRKGALYSPALWWIQETYPSTATGRRLMTFPLHSPSATFFIHPRKEYNSLPSGKPSKFCGQAIGYLCELSHAGRYWMCLGLAAALCFG